MASPEVAGGKLLHFLEDSHFLSIEHFITIKNEASQLLNSALSRWGRTRQRNFRSEITVVGKTVVILFDIISRKIHFYVDGESGHSHVPHGITEHYIGLDELIPLKIYETAVTSSHNHDEAIAELKKNNLANKVIDVYYRIKRNVEYIAEGKESLYSIYPHYPTVSNLFIDARHSKHYFYLIAYHPNISFGYIINLAIHILQNNKIRLEQNTKGLQGYKLL